jgi:hypothetical protein
MNVQGTGLGLSSTRSIRVTTALLGVAALLAIGVGPAITPARASTPTTVLSQNWGSGLKSETPAATVIDPLTGKGDQWLVFSGGWPEVGGANETREPAQGDPDTELVGNDVVEGWPTTAKFFGGTGGTETVDHPHKDSHNFWHVQSEPQDISLNPFITENLVALPSGDSPALPSPTTGSNVAWFGSATSGTYCDTLKEVEENSSNAVGSDNGCETKPDAEEFANGAEESGGVGDGNTDQEGELVSPPFSLVGAESAVLHFNSWFEVEAVEANLFDIMEIDYTTDKGTAGDPFKWRELGTLNPEDDTAGAPFEDYTDEGQDTAPTWQPILADLKPAIGSPEVRVRFVFDSWDVLYNGFRGWLLDGVNVVTPSNAGEPQITGVDVCSGTSVAPITVIHGSNFFVGSTVKVDGVEQPGQTPSSTRVEIPAISAGTHVIQVLDPNGGAKSNEFTVEQPASCEPAPSTTTTTTTTTSTPPPPPPPPPPPTNPPLAKSKVIVNDETGEIENEYEFPEPGEVEDEGVVEEGASLARFEGNPLGPFGGEVTAFAAKKAKCKRGFVSKGGKCLNNKPVQYGRVAATITKAGRYKLRIKPTKKVLAALKKGKTLYVKLTLSFKPQDTTVRIRVRHVNNIPVHLKRKHHKK